MLAPAALAFGLSGVLAPVALTLLRRAGILDHPSERSSHAVPVPRGGGVAPALGAMLALLLASSLEGRQRVVIAVAAAVLGLIGLVDDVVGVRALFRLASQFLAATVVGVLLLGTQSGPDRWRLAVGIGIVFWLVAFVNAFNFMDGIDGISVAQAVGAGVTWALVGLHTDSAAMAAGGAIIAGAAFGFAPFNIPRARMFLGDVGSYFLGAWLAVVAVLGIRGGVAPEAVLAPLVLYAADTGTTLVRRIAHGECWYLPHRDHAYQRLGAAGWSHARTSAFVCVCIVACGALGALSLTGSVVLRVIADGAIVAIVGAYLLTPRWLARSRTPLAIA